jgi:uncharacterized protein with ParB-like and HNH nuclease domain
MRFRDIEQFPRAYYQVNIDIDGVKRALDNWDEPHHGSPLILNPDFQRGHVWTEKQQIAFLEYFFKGGTTGRDIYFNCSSWQEGYNTPIYCVDGLQRLTAAIAFIENKIKVYGGYLKDYEDRPRMITNTFIFHMLKIRNKKELLKIYLDFNSAGTKHSTKELDRIAKMIQDTPETEVL